MGNAFPKYYVHLIFWNVKYPNLNKDFFQQCDFSSHEHLCKYICKEVMPMESYGSKYIRE